MARAKTFDPAVALSAALDAFWRRGYTQTSLDDLTEAMGLGRASLYNAFGDKHALFLRALDRYSDERMAELDQALNSTAGARSAIERVLRRTADVLWSDPLRRGCLLVNSTTELAAADPAVAARAAQAFERTVSAFRSALERGIHRGEFPKTMDVRSISRLLASTLTSLRVLSKMTDRSVAEDILTQILDALDRSV